MTVKNGFLKYIELGNDMTGISKSPQRHTFQAEAYVKRCEEEGKEPREDYLNIYKSARQQDEENMTDPKWQKDNLEYDLRSTDWVLEKARTRESYAQNIYAALCNMRWQRLDVFPILKDEFWSCSWRHAGGIVADMRREGDYMDWYCSGMGGLNREYEGDETNEEWQKRTGYVPESVVTEEIRADFQKLGWVPSPWPEDDI
jgi:hypothetical protein